MKKQVKSFGEFAKSKTIKLNEMHGYYNIEKVEPGNPDNTGSYLVVAADMDSNNYRGERVRQPRQERGFYSNRESFGNFQIRVYAKVSLAEFDYGPNAIEPVAVTDVMGNSLSWEEAAHMMGLPFSEDEDLENSIFWLRCTEELIMQNEEEMGELGFR